MNRILVDAVAVAVLLPVLGLLLWPRIRRHEAWRAMVTPLASIIGSGFLVVGPILAGIAGAWAPLAMASLCLMAWLFGTAIRFNIVHAEPLRENNERPALKRFDQFSELCLALAYFISVAYYLNLLGAFLLKGIDVTDPNLARIVTTVIILGLGLLGWLRGFKGIERVEIYAVSFKLAVIAAVIAALALVYIGHHGPQHSPQPTLHAHWHGLRVLLGSVILVQGFETSRFLGKHYDTHTRTRSMWQAKLLASVIYVAFIFLLMPHVPSHQASGTAKETEIIDIVGKLAGLLGPMLVIAAVASQLSAAIADMGGAGGLLGELWSRIKAPMAYAGITVLAVALTWVSDIFEIIAIASRAFAVYYALQCVLAAILARGRPLRRGFFVVGAVLALAVVVLGLPAD